MVGYDTELFGHWWHEGPMWLDRVLRLLPGSGVKVTTLGSAISDGAVAGSASPRNSSWGSGKDWSVWAGDAVTGMVEDNDGLMRNWRKLIDDAVHSGLATTRVRCSISWLAMLCSHCRERLGIHGQQRIRQRSTPAIGIDSITATSCA